MKKGIIILLGVVLVLALIFYFDNRVSKSGNRELKRAAATTAVVVLRVPSGAQAA